MVAAALVGAGLMVSAVNWLLANWWLLVVPGMTAAAAGGAWLYRWVIPPDPRPLGLWARPLRELLPAVPRPRKPPARP